MAKVSMKLTKKDNKNRLDMPVASTEDREEYPYGLQISLESPELKKLGIDPQSLKIGSTMIIEAEATISNISIRKMKDNDQKSMSLQITKMDLSETP